MRGIKVLLILLIIIVLITGCSNNLGFDSRDPVIITLWHHYGGLMEEAMNNLVNEFNCTVGKEKGIIVNITSVSSTSAIYDKIFASVDGIPGSSELPNITTGYPKAALLLLNSGKLVDLKEYFSKEELDQYLPQFIEEGMISDMLAVFPTSKSTEVLFLNKTLFQRFSEATGTSIDSLYTFEGISEAAVKYYEWTDSLTPEIHNDGKPFYTSDSWFNNVQVCMNQLDDAFIVNENFNYSENYDRIWNTFYEAVKKGGIAIYDGYSADLAKTGDIVCSTGSSAGVLFYGNTVTYRDNTKLNVEYEILPYPVFRGGKKAAIQRGCGMIISKSTKEKENASVQFLKWFTAPDQNIKFISQTGYLPVTRTAIDIITNQNNAENSNVSKLLNTVIKMYNEYDFFIPPVFDDYDLMEKTYNERIKNIWVSARTDFLTSSDT